MGIGLTASSASNFKMNRLPGEIDCRLSLCKHLRLTSDFTFRLGQAILRLPRWRRKFLLLIWKRTALRSNLHDQRCHRLWSEPRRQYLLLYQERTSPGHCLPRSAIETLSNSWSPDAWRDRRRQFRSKAVPVRRARHDSRIACFHKNCDLLVSTARWPGRLDSDYAKVTSRAYLAPALANLTNVFIFRMVSSYLVHHGYSSTAEKFAEITGQSFTEDINSIKTRQSKWGR